MGQHFFTLGRFASASKAQHTTRTVMKWLLHKVNAIGLGHKEMDEAIAGSQATDIVADYNQYVRQQYSDKVNKS
jgi:hypothetical protein